MEYTIEATIPTTQYGNIRPSFTINDMQKEGEVLETLKRLWDKYGEKPLVEKNETGGKPMVSFTDEAIVWNEAKHIYTDMDGKVLLSGSKYAAQHSPKFAKELILPKTAKAWGLEEAQIDDIWGMKGECSMDLGNAIHKALELYHVHQAAGNTAMEASAKMDENYALPKQPYLRRLVLDFVEKFGHDALSEVVVSDVANGMAGTIDRLQIIDEDKMICRVQDYKSNTDIKKAKKVEYQKQMSFYSRILINKGWTVQGMDLFFLDDDESWVKEEFEVLELES